MRRFIRSTCNSPSPPFNGDPSVVAGLPLEFTWTDSCMSTWPMVLRSLALLAILSVPFNLAQSNPTPSSPKTEEAPKFLLQTRYVYVEAMDGDDLIGAALGGPQSHP